MFATASLARRIERAETGIIEEGARAAARRLPHGQLLVREMNGGAAVFVEKDAPFNKVAGLGFDGVPPAEVLTQLEQDFAVRRAPLQFEISTLADPAVARALTTRGYELAGFENVLGLALDPSAHFEPIAAPGFERYIARRGGVIAGGGNFRMQDGVAQLIGAATLPMHRRQGVQTALLRHRLAEAARRGCDIAVVTTEPGSRSQENVQKAGFALLYARAVLVKAPGSPLPGTAER